MTPEEALIQFRQIPPYLGGKYSVADAHKAMSAFLDAINKDPRRLTIRDLTRIATFIEQWRIE